MAAINFNLNTSANYREVQRQLTDLVQLHLNKNDYTETHTLRQPDALNFSWFIREDTDVVMSHGVADKNYFWMNNPYTGKKYINGLKAVLVPGDWMRQRMLNSSHILLKEDQIISAGWPRLDLLRQLQASVAVPSPSEAIKILWAPTHDKRKRGAEQRSTSTYPEFEVDAQRLANQFDVASSLHPRNRKDKEPTVDKLLRSNVVISDFGTMVYEAWALGKPVIFPRWILKDSIETYLPNSAEAFIFKNRIGYHPESYQELLAILENGPVIEPAVHDFMQSYLDNYRSGCSGEKVAKALLSLAADR